MNEQATKAYKINMSMISEGFTFDDIYCYAHSANEARSKLLEKVRYERLQLKYTGKDVDYLTIPVSRFKHMDLVEFEGKLFSQIEIDRELTQRKRISYLDSILNDPTVSHCYIKKNGSYYRPDSCGYTQFKVFAGIYLKEDAVNNHGKRADELQIIPVNTEEHNKLLNEEIEEIKTRIIL